MKKIITLLAGMMFLAISVAAYAKGDFLGEYSKNLTPGSKGEPSYAGLNLELISPNTRNL